MSKNKTPPRLSYVTPVHFGTQRVSTITLDGVLPYPANPSKPYTCNTSDRANVVPLKAVRAAYELFLQQTEALVGTDLYCQSDSSDLDSTPRVIQVVHEPEAAYEARLNTTKMAKVNTLKERLAQHDAAAAAIRAELEKAE